MIIALVYMHVLITTGVNKLALKIMLPYVVLHDGTVVAEHHNPAVPEAVLREILQLTAQGTAMEDIIDLLRCRTVPTGYIPHLWHPGWNGNITGL